MTTGLDYRIKRTPLSQGLSEAMVELEGVLKTRSLNFKDAAEALGVSAESLSRARAGVSAWTNQSHVTSRIRRWITRPDEVWMLEEYMRSHQLSQAGTAKKLNVSPATLSAMLSGEYFNVPTVTGGRILPRLKEFIWGLKAGIERPEVAFLRTSVAKAVFGVCRVARQDKKKIMLIAANPGTGKTTALKRYQFEHPGTFLVELSCGVGPKQALQRILEAAHLKRGGDAETSRRRLIERFQGTDDLLIIDEANQLKIEGLEILRHIKDVTGVGMVLSGTMELLKKIEAEEDDKLGQLSDRIRIKLKIETITEADASTYIRAALSHVNGKLTDEMITTFYAMSSARRQGGRPWVSMRRLENLVEESLRLIRVRKEDLSKEIIQDAWGLCTGIQTNT